MLADEFKNNFLVKKAEIVSRKPEHQNEIHFLKRRISVDDFGWHVKLDQRYVKMLLDATAMIISNRWPLLDRRDRRTATL